MACTPQQAQTRIAQLARQIAKDGVTFTRLRPPTNGAAFLKDEYRGLWDAIPIRPNYPGEVLSLGGENQDNADRHSLLLPATDADGKIIDIRETDEITLKADPLHVWIVAKADMPLIIDDTLVGWAIWVERLRRA